MYEIKIIHKMKGESHMSIVYLLTQRPKNPKYTKQFWQIYKNLQRATDSRGNPCFGISSYLPAVYSEMWTASR